MKHQHSVFISIAMIAFSSFVISSCKDKCEEAGLGGTFTIAAFPEHHDLPIFSQDTYVDSAFVKFNTRELPGTNPSDFDLVIAGEPGEDHVHIEGLKCGDYFVYMTGFDTAFGQRVDGGVPLTISEDGPSEIDLEVAVSE